MASRKRRSAKPPEGFKMAKHGHCHEDCNISADNDSRLTGVSHGKKLAEMLAIAVPNELERKVAIASFLEECHVNCQPDENCNPKTPKKRKAQPLLVTPRKSIAPEDIVSFDKNAFYHD